MTDPTGENAPSGDVTVLSTAEESAPSELAADTASAQRPGVPAWRVGKPDVFLAADVAAAREAVLSIAAAADIGAHVGARSEGVRCVTHLFESRKAGYRGWVWFATLSRISRAKESTVNEVGLLPTEDAVLAPAWVPWSERVRPEDREEEAAAEAQRNNPEAHDDGRHDRDDAQDAQGSGEDDEAHDDDAAEHDGSAHDDDAAELDGSAHDDDAAAHDGSAHDDDAADSEN